MSAEQLHCRTCSALVSGTAQPSFRLSLGCS